MVSPFSASKETSIAEVGEEVGDGTGVTVRTGLGVGVFTPDVTGEAVFCMRTDCSGVVRTTLQADSTNSHTTHPARKQPLMAGAFRKAGVR